MKVPLGAVDAIDSLALEIESEQAARRLALRDFDNEQTRATLLTAHGLSFERVCAAARALVDLLPK